MTGRWADSTSRDDLPPDWPQRRAATRRRAGGRCEGRVRGHRCPNPGTDCDHRIPRWRGGTHDLGNLQWLCPTCHATKTQREAQQARAARAAQRYRTPEAHPGHRTPGAR
ncbi:HNH endonuclease signature motif containing protein [Saccharothrix coeruleofusca]|uniref:HNH endonuclease signature motif containing protein n=1 Tax=Saccharothrix coeruleofusca TaxID=33919 RepID=UPI001AE16C0E